MALNVDMEAFANIPFEQHLLTPYVWIKALRVDYVLLNRDTIVLECGI